MVHWIHWVGLGIPTAITMLWLAGKHLERWLGLSHYRGWPLISLGQLVTLYR